MVNIIPSFRGDDKLFFMGFIAVYSEIIAFLILAVTGLLIVAITVISIAIPITIMSLFLFWLWTMNKLRGEIGGKSFFVGFMVNKAGKFGYTEFAIIDKKEIDTTDMQLEKFEKGRLFNEAKNKFSMLEKEIPGVEDIDDTFVDDKLMYEYSGLGLKTSKQIFCYEILKYSTQLNNKDKDKIKFFEEIKENLIKVESIGQKTKLLIEAVEKTGGKRGFYDNLKKYEDELLELKNISYEREPFIDESNKKMKISSSGLIITIIIILLLNILINNPFILNPETYIINSAGIFIVSIIGFIFILIFTIKLYKVVQYRSSLPFIIKFENIFTKNVKTTAYCYLKQQLKSYNTDSRIYKLKTFNSHFPNEEIHLITPDSYGDSFDFNPGRVGYKGYSIEASTSPVVLFEIGTMLDSIPIYMAVFSTYYVKRLSKIFYSYSLFQNWLNKIYLWIISQLQTKIELLQPKFDALNSRIIESNSLIRSISQNRTADRNLMANSIDQMQQPIQSTNNRGQGQPQNQIIQEKPINKIFLILCIIGIIIGIIGWTT